MGNPEYLGATDAIAEGDKRLRAADKTPRTDERSWQHNVQLAQAAYARATALAAVETAREMRRAADALARLASRA